MVGCTLARQRFHAQCRGQGVANTCTAEAQIKRKCHRYLFMLSVKLSLNFLHTMTRVLSGTYFSLLLQGILGIMGRIYGERYRKAILCTFSSDSKLLAVKHMNAASAYRFAASWSQSLDISSDSKLDISQLHIMSLIH